METYDVIIIGAGHNGLVCAAYLLKAGYQVLLLEKRPVPGGAATTEEAMPVEAPGFKFNLCAIDHEFIHLGPVVAELELTKYGLDYLPCDPVVYCPLADGSQFVAHKSIAQTCAGIAEYSPRDAQKYGEFAQYWLEVGNVIAPLFNAPPMAIFDIAGNYGTANLKDLFKVAGSKTKALDFVRNMLTSPTDLLNEWFDSETVKAPLARLAAEIGAPPSQKGIAVGAMMMAMRHSPGMSRPRGGTGALTAALVKLVLAQGGKICTDQGVKRLLMDGNRVVGVETVQGQEYRASRGVISNIDARRLFLNLMDPGDLRGLAPELGDRLDRRIVNNNETILKIDCALSEPPRFEAYGHREENLIGSILIADSVDHVEKAHALCAFGEIPDQDPSLYVVCPTVLDPSMAPEGKHTLWIEFFAPYQIAGAAGTGLDGTGWTDELKNQVGDRIMAKLADYAPNLRHSVIARRVESPAELAQRLGTHKGNYYHMDMTLDQMIFFRPLPELADYKTPIQGLYLTGAGTHPGGSISGMPGRNCARVFLQSQQPFVHRWGDAQAYIRTLLKTAFGLPAS